MATSRIGLQKKLDYVNEFCAKWDLKININKTKVLVGNKGGKMSLKEKWYVDGNKVETVKSFKYLGVIINHNGKWDLQSKQAKIIGENAFNSVFRLKYKVKNVKSKIMINTYRALVEARLLYGVEAWGCLNTEIIIFSLY